jgi:6-phosphogluconate dehydrogenase
MGVSGVGKSTIGNLLSEKLGIPFFDGDDFHPEGNIKKMSAGQALNDDDRQGWLEKINLLAKDALKKRGCIIACSALKESYRNILSFGLNDSVTFVFLSGSFEQIKKRIDSRGGHYMRSDLLKSQFDILEEPEVAIKIDINFKPKEIVGIIENKIIEKVQFGF